MLRSLNAPYKLPATCDGVFNKANHHGPHPLFPGDSVTWPAVS